jgi:hypothetical protein
VCCYLCVKRRISSFAGHSTVYLFSASVYHTSNLFFKVGPVAPLAIAIDMRSVACRLPCQGSVLAITIARVAQAVASATGPLKSAWLRRVTLKFKTRM